MSQPRASAKQSKSAGPKKKKQFTPAQLVSKAEQCLDKCQPELASKFYKRALALQPHNTDIMDDLAHVLAEMHCEDEAKQYTLKSCEIAPGINPSKWMYLAQMQDGNEALSSFQKGLAILQAEAGKMAQAGEPSESIHIINKEICNTLVSMAELYMTDLCMEDVAEARCEELLKSAVTYDADSPQPLQAIANMRMSQSRVEEATKMLEQVYIKLCACGTYVLLGMCVLPF